MNTKPFEKIVEIGTHAVLEPYATYHTRQQAMPDNWLLCADGTKLSVIAGSGTYSNPREHGPYTHVEVGFPSPYPDWWKDVNENVMACVPVETVRQYIVEHGGIVRTAKTDRVFDKGDPK